MPDLLDKVPPVFKSLWQLENELRSALQNTVLLRKQEARKHMDSAKGHLDQALKELRASRGKQAKPSDKLNYGEGQRAEYGEGTRYRPEDLTKGADHSTSHGWAGGGSDDATSIPDPKPKQ